MSQCLKKTIKNSSCSKGTHTFIPAVWKKQGDKEICEMFVCQHCMMPFEKTEREIMCQHYKKEEEKDAEKNEN